MNSNEQKTSLPTWLFVLTDLALIGAAAVIALRSAPPLSSGAMLAIVGCVGLGAIVGLVPIIARYERLKNEALDDRQRALEALSRTVAASAEQISIATGSLNEIAEHSQKYLRHAEHLPHKLQEKIAEFQAQLAEANDAEKEELEKEVIELRASESERLEAIATKVAKSAAEWAKLETTVAQHLAAATEATAKLPAGAAAAIAKAQAAADQSLAEARAAADQALAEARVTAVKTVAEAEANAARAIAGAQAASLVALDAKLAAFEARIHAASDNAGERAAAELKAAMAAAIRSLEEKLTQLDAIAARIPNTVIATPPPAEVHAAPATPAEPVAISPAPTAETVPATPHDEPPHHAPKRQRRTRREESPAPETAPEPAPEPQPAAVVAPIEVPAPAADVASAETAEPFAAPAAPEVAAEPAPAEVVPSEPAPEPAPEVAPEPVLEAAPEATPEVTPESTPESSTPPPAENAAPVAPEIAETEAPPAAPKKRSARKPAPAPDPEPALDLPLEEASPGAPAGGLERTLASDGATRLLATAYIGIGNRLFIRGDGPGLTWEKGVPLQFVSIGKWRWETNDATAPVRFKLFKNDEVECITLGEQVLEPGHLQELTATF